MRRIIPSPAKMVKQSLVSGGETFYKCNCRSQGKFVLNSRSLASTTSIGGAEYKNMQRKLFVICEWLFFIY
jgi:hypothetical protein